MLDGVLNEWLQQQVRDSNGSYGAAIQIGPTLSYPAEVAVDAAGSLFVADLWMFAP